MDEYSSHIVGTEFPTCSKCMYKIRIYKILGINKGKGYEKIESKQYVDMALLLKREKGKWKYSINVEEQNQRGKVVNHNLQSADGAPFPCMTGTM